MNTHTTHHTRRLQRAKAARAKAERELRAAVVAARDDGMSARAVGAELGLSHVRVLQLEKEGRNDG